MKYDLNFTNHSSASESVLARMMAIEAAPPMSASEYVPNPKVKKICLEDIEAERLTSQGDIDPLTGKGVHVAYRKTVARPFMETSCGAVKSHTLMTENNAR